MNIFSSIKTYAGKWSVTGNRHFTEEEIAQIEEAVVVDSQYGLSVQFTRKDGAMAFIPLSQDSNLGSGETVDMKEAVLLTLSKPGENDIYRIEA